MYRKIYNNLLDWKNKQHRKPLLMLGARQVGKTYIVKALGKQEFKNFVHINCHKDSRVVNLFCDMDTKRILREISRIFDIKITQGDTLLFFDEIQEVPNGIASLKYFCEDEPDLHVIVAGSLLGISLRENESFPVGKVETIRMFPMTFSEFLLAKGKKGLTIALENLEWDTLKTAHNDLIEYLREYYCVGGMPEAVQTYISTNDIHKVRKVQKEILDAYKQDISKHTKTMVTRIHQVWDNIPAQLAKENKKFIYGAIRKGARASEYELAIQWLLDAGLIYKVELAKCPTRPLKFYCESSIFKIYLLDCGLLSCMSETNPNEMLLGSNAFVEFKGAFTENFVLQQLKSIDTIPVYYYSKENSTIEIDFLAQTGRIVPTEVKAEINVKSKSLSNFINIDFATNNLKGLRISMLPYKDQLWMENIPLYATESYFIKETSEQ